MAEEQTWKTKESTGGVKMDQGEHVKGLTLLYHPGIHYRDVGEHLCLNDCLEGAGDTLKVGRKNQLFGRELDDRELSKAHFAIRALDAGQDRLSFHLRDCGSTNGTFLLRARNSGDLPSRRVMVPVDRTGYLLKEGDIIKAGRLFLHFETSSLVGDLSREH